MRRKTSKLRELPDSYLKQIPGPKIHKPKPLVAHTVTIATVSTTEEPVYIPTPISVGEPKDISQFFTIYSNFKKEAILVESELISVNLMKVLVEVECAGYTVHFGQGKTINRELRNNFSLIVTTHHLEALQNGCVPIEPSWTQDSLLIERKIFRLLVDEDYFEDRLQKAREGIDSATYNCF